MPVEAIHTYLVYPDKGMDEPNQIGGAEVPLTGKVFDLLNGVYAGTQDECTIDISFNPRANGDAENPCRSLICSYLAAPSIPNGRMIAERLSSVTTRRSGLGLMFVVQGREGTHRKIVIARFPANSGILAEQGERALTVQFLERVFMRSAFAYKAVVYQDVSLEAGFWTGRAIDRQINSSETEVSRYWVTDFLDSDFRTTSAAGTKRLAVAMRTAARSSNDLSVKREIAAAVTLAEGLNGQTMTTTDFVQRFGLSENARTAIVREMRHPGLANEQFRFDSNEFAQQVPYRTIELDSGAILTADAKSFDEVFEKEEFDEGSRVRFSTTGTVISEKLEKTR